MLQFKVWLKKILAEDSRARRLIGALFILYGFFALLTPFTPGSWLIFVGLEFVGIRLAFWDQMKSWFRK